ncbi:MAG: HlyD family efflux transporter periplasmic adaptor subunit [Bacteroidales bacterium]|jgi:multidrug efflux pump subunit AcrA (membrane-fusion protein)
MKKTVRKLYIVTWVLGALLTISFSCTNSRPSAGGEQKIITPVTITAISTGQISESIELPAISTFLNKNIVRSTTTGTIEKVLVTFGDYIRTDQLLFTLRTREASVIAGSMRSDSSLALKGEIKMRASRDGVITSVSHQGGDFVQEGDELATISDRESFVFILDVPFELTSLIDHNRKCIMLFPDGRTVSGNIGGQLPEMDPLAQTVKYFIKTPFSATLPSNLSVKVKLVKRERSNATILPREAVLGNETQTEFWIMKLINDSVAVRVPVKKGIENNSVIEISEPVLLQSDRIVLTGGYGLPDTANVIVKK